MSVSFDLTPPVVKGVDSKEDVKKLTSYICQLTEQLRYALGNVGLNNLDSETKKLVLATSDFVKSGISIPESQQEIINSLKTEIIKTATEITNEYTAAIETSETGITSTVTRDFVARNEYDEYKAQTSSRIDQTDANITDTFTKAEQIDTDLQSYKTDTEAYIRRGELETDVYGVEIGRTDSSLKIRLTNEKLSFYQGTTEVAYISNSKLYITSAEVTDIFTIGNSTYGYTDFVVNSHGFSILWRDV